MTPTFHKIDYDIILGMLYETKDQLNDIGLKTEDYRLTDILKYVNLICDFHKRNKVDELVNNFNNEILWYALLESSALIDVYQAFNGLKNHQVPRRKLQEILSGPFLPKDEDPTAQNFENSNQKMIHFSR